MFGDAGYQGVEKRDETQGIVVDWHVAMRPGKRRALDKASVLGKLQDELERVKARIRAKVEHPFRVIKRQFGHMKARYRGRMKNTQQLHTLFALSNLWMTRHQLQASPKGQLRPGVTSKHRYTADNVPAHDESGVESERNSSSKASDNAQHLCSPSPTLF